MKTRITLQKRYMVHTIKKSVLAVAFFGFVLSLCSSCVVYDPLPSKDEIQQYFDRNYYDILCINDFIISSDYQFFRLDNYDRKLSGDFKVFADYDYSVALPDNVNNAVKRLGENGKLAISYSTDTMTVQYEVWYDYHDRGCGFAFLVTEQSNPDILYLLSCEPLNNKGWYYYITDYNATR